MQDSANKKQSETKSEAKTENAAKKEYQFGGIEEYNLEKIEETILEESIYLDVFAGSDIAFKENIEPLNNVLSKVNGLSCISYDYKTEEFANKNFSSTRQLGVIAQEIQSAFPELVKNDQDGDLQVNYSQLSTVALQAIKELNSLLLKSNERIAALEAEIAKLKS